MSDNNSNAVLIGCIVIALVGVVALVCGGFLFIGLFAARSTTVITPPTPVAPQPIKTAPVEIPEIEIEISPKTESDPEVEKKEDSAKSESDTVEKKAADESSDP